MAPTPFGPRSPGPFACIPERSGGTPGSYPHPSGRGGFLRRQGAAEPPLASLDLHPPLRFRTMRGKIATSAEGGKGGEAEYYRHNDTGSVQERRWTLPHVLVHIIRGLSEGPERRPVLRRAAPRDQPTQPSQAGRGKDYSMPVRSAFQRATAWRVASKPRGGIWSGRKNSAASASSPARRMPPRTSAR